MPGNSFGQFFKITSWGESHGKALGVVVDGCPAGIKLNEKDIQTELDKRKPGQSRFTTPRKESDKVQILSGTFNSGGGSIASTVLFGIILVSTESLIIIFFARATLAPASAGFDINFIKPSIPLYSGFTN